MVRPDRMAMGVARFALKARRTSLKCAVLNCTPSWTRAVSEGITDGPVCAECGTRMGKAKK